MVTFSDAKRLGGTAQSLLVNAVCRGRYHWAHLAVKHCLHVDTSWNTYCRQFILACGEFIVVPRKNKYWRKAFTGLL